ncbi:RagB/SusD family nutrient uptake outer membrane protein [Niabella yanshanensis]|uniref:RagB/SusD family nutrient uptake outer membrane protein n=1 Tax=Niabella yanshanensis TaxID=577386 RepID=A0ABZ0W2S4_9BACT|nr:RagB/SusD family nutrient uptake outer membrane protein [Niabella yanshanensis]WQD36928.1 RagB/SusD family nutrient uptake outer membrane protein [Niabella yanshanensis]
MKQLKNGWFIYALAFSLLGAVGCKKFLDREPLTATLPDLKQGALESQSYNMYRLMRTNSGLTELVWLDFHSIRDDDAQKGSDAGDGTEVVGMYDKFGYAKSGWAPDTYWNDHYALITAANTSIHLAKTNNLTDAASLRNVGEACFFMAHSYFELVKAYGEVPIVNFFVSKPSDAIRPKSSVEDVYKFIDSNLLVAERLLPLTSAEYGAGFDGRLTRAAAHTLAAQTFLFRKQWDSVLNRVNKVIDMNKYSLPKFTDVWKDGKSGAGKNGPESIWEMQSTVGENGANISAKDQGSNWAVSQNVRRNGAPVFWNFGWGWNTPTDKLESEWPSTDPRKKATILYSGQYDGGPEQGGYGLTLPAYTNPEGAGGLAQKFWNKKVYADPEMRTFTGFIDGGAGRWINRRILRYADVILMKAEAANEKGDGATAEAMLELVRNRASGFLGTGRAIVPKIAFTGQAQMRQAIKDERRWEFAMEGYRFYDLVRWGDAVTILGPLGFTPRCQYHPIPQAAIDLSGGVLKQNPNWN